jgi:translation initiation factor IF-3
VDGDGLQVGVLSRTDALAYAQEHGVDLVEIAPDAKPPVAKAIDYGRWRFEEERRLRAGRRNQVHGAPKEVRLRPRIAPHDYEWKRDNARAFLRARSKVKLVVLFRGRERERPDVGRELLKRIAEDVQDVGRVEGRESFEGRTMTVVLAPNGGDG